MDGGGNDSLFLYDKTLYIIFRGQGVDYFVFIKRGGQKSFAWRKVSNLPPQKNKKTRQGIFDGFTPLFKFFSRHLIVPDGDYLAGSRPKIKGEQLHSKGCVQYSPYSRLNWFETWSYLLDLKINVKYTTFIFFHSVILIE